ncbi:putative ankyrin repeat protein RF_0381 [Harmonia axyridis]|uniref:putative ankyrin repeat protein RF_0381 n=1 Tax=Harmonia axyridis TaxID=115357 RepID=UPI001E278952|nr:putative ankyrin repeat protein RF_0381 [Harmonia axyridis]
MSSDVSINEPIDDQYNTVLHKAVKKGDEKKTLKLLKRGANPNIPDLGHLRTLHLAVKYGHLHLIPILVEYGANLDLKTHEGYRAIHMLVESPKQIECLEQLLALGADINIRDSSGNNLLFLFLKSDIKDVSLFKKLLENGADVKNTDLLRSNGLHILASKKKINSCITKVIAEGLIAQGIDVNAKDFFGETPLHLASHGNNAELLSILLHNNARMDLVNDKNMTAFQTAVEAKNSTALLVRGFIKRSHHIPIDDPVDDQRNTALHVAVKKGDEKKCLKLLKRGADPDARNIEGLTTLHMAVKYGHLELMKILVEYGADTELQTNLGYRSIHMVMESPNRIECLEKLLALRADINRRDCMGNSILFLLLKSDIKEITFFKKLLKHGANVNNRDTLKSTGLHILASKINISSYLTKVIAESLIAGGINVDAKDFFGDTPLHLAAFGNNPQLLTILLRNNARLDLVNDKNLTAFELAVEFQNGDAVFAMLKHAVLNSYIGKPNDEKMMKNIMSDLELLTCFERLKKELDILKRKKILDFTVYEILCKKVEEIMDYTRGVDNFVVLSHPFVVWSSFNREIVINWNLAKNTARDVPIREVLI